MGNFSFCGVLRTATGWIATRTIRHAFFAVVILIPTVTSWHGAQAGAAHVLYSFCAKRAAETGACKDGASPAANLIEDTNGALYGTTQSGGMRDSGTVFEINGKSETVLYAFCRKTNCRDGSAPRAGLIEDGSGNFYGTTQSGGANNSGVAFELSLAGDAWTETALHDFCTKSSCTDGGNPVAGLLMDNAGNLYGTTESGGSGAAGLVFELTRNKITGHWIEHALYQFCSVAACADGANSQAGLVMDNAGNLYGTTENGGLHNRGTVFELSWNPARQKWTETVLHNFCTVPGTSNACYDGASPVAALSIDGSGNLYGTTMQGGAGNPGNGAVFKLTYNPSGNTFSFGVLYRFCAAGSSTCDDGVSPQSTLVLDKVGNLNGTTASSVAPGQYNGGGTIFRLKPNGKEISLFQFCGANCTNGINDGLSPEAGLIIDPTTGNLYGTTGLGGRHNAGGEVFEVEP